MTRPRRGSSDRILDAVEAGLWIALLAFGSFVALAVMRPEAPAPSRSPAFVAPAGFREAEALPIAAKSRDFTFWLQPTAGFPGGGWSRDGHMFALGTREGDWIELELPETPPGSQRLEVFLTRAADYGIVVLSLNGTRISGDVDLWSDRGVVPTGPLDLGSVQLREDRNLLRIEVKGANARASAPFFQFGIDGLRLTSSPSPSSSDTLNEPARSSSSGSAAR